MSSRVVTTTEYACDRCGCGNTSNTDWSNLKAQRANGGTVGFTYQYDLCVKCTEELTRWLTAPLNQPEEPMT